MMIHSRTALAERFFSGNSATYEHIANFSTLGLDHWWKRKILNKIPQHPTQIVDQACGTGLLTFKIAQRFPLCRIVGVDLQDEYLAIGNTKAQALQLTTVEFIHRKAEDVALEADFDCITSCYLAKYADLLFCHWATNPHVFYPMPPTFVAR